MNKEINTKFQERLLTVLADFILKRGWRLKLAKKEPIEQSLFIHSMNELGVIQSYLEKSLHPFNGAEIIKLYISSITHDCEKETNEWQEKISFGEKPPHHTNPEYAAKFVSDLLTFLRMKGVDIDFDQNDINDIISSQALHMKASAKSPSNVFGEMTREHKSERWSEIAHLVDLFDDIVSKESIESVIVLLNKDEYAMLNERLEFAYHKIGNVRGILTSLLHRACEKTYEKHGYLTFLYYPDGTLYIKIKKDDMTPTGNLYNDIDVEFENVVNDFLEKIDPSYEVRATIGRADRNLLLLPEFLTKTKIRNYFTALKTKGKSPTSEDNVVKYMVYRGLLDKYSSLEEASKALNMSISEKKKFVKNILEADRLNQVKAEIIANFRGKGELIKAKIHESKPQQYMFQLFKEIVKDNLNTEEEFVKAVKKDFDAIFGEGFFEKVIAKSTSMPYIDFADLVEPYWNLNPRKFGINREIKKIQSLSKTEQENILIETLSKILINNIDKCSKLPKDLFFGEISQLLISSDLIFPLPSYQNIMEIAQEQFKVIGESKENIFGERKRKKRLCPVCNKLMPKKNLLRADLLSDDAGTEVFNNKGVAGINVKGGVNICLLCYAELILRRVLLGRTPSDLVILFPSLNFAKIQASRVMELMRDVQNKLGQFYSYHNPNLNERIKWTDLRILTSQILDEKAEEISAKLNPDEFINSFKVHVYKNEKERELKKLEDRLIQDYNNKVDEFNEDFETYFKSFKEIAEAIFERGIEIPRNKEPDLNEIIEEAGVNPIRYSLIYETPNFIVISLPTTFSYDENEAEVNILLKRLLFASYLYLLTDCAVMVIPGKEVLHIPQTRKIVYVQPNATLKQVIKEDWISLFDLQKWMVAISSAVRIGSERDNSGKGIFSERRGIFEVLTQPTVGHILSRITSQKTQSGALKRADRRLIGMLDKLHDTGVLKNEVVNANYFIHKRSMEFGS